MKHNNNIIIGLVSLVFIVIIIATKIPIWLFICIGIIYCVLVYYAIKYNSYHININIKDDENRNTSNS